MEVKMKKSGVKPKHYIPVIIIMLFMAVFFTINDHRRIEKLYEEFPEINSNDSINELITDIYSERGACFVTLMHDKKILIHNSRNYLYEDISLMNYIQIGDSLLKKRGSDTIYLRNKEKNKYFVFGEMINRK